MFNTKETEIIKWGLANGKSKEQVTQALTNFRTGVVSKPKVEETQETQESQGGIFTPLTTLYGGGEDGIAQKLKRDVQGGADDIQRGIARTEAAKDTEGFAGVKERLAGGGDVLSGVVKSGFRTAGDVAQAVYAPVGTALNAVTGGYLGKFFDAVGKISQMGGDYNPINAITDMKAVQDFVAENPNLEEDFNRGLTLAFAGLDKGKIDPKTVIPRTIEQVKSASTAVSNVGNTVRNTVRNDISTAKNAVNKIVDKTKDIASKKAPKSVENVLKETESAQFDKALEVARKSVENNKNPSGFEVVGDRAGQALDQIQRKLSNIGSSKSKVMETVAGRKPVGNIVVKYRQQIDNALKTKTYTGGDAKLFKDVTREATKLGSNPNASAVDKFIDYVQDRIYTGSKDLTVPITDSSVATLRRFTGELNTSLKSQLPTSYSNLNKQFSDLVGVRNELNLKLGAGGERAGALVKRIFSPADANTKNLFAKVKEITGIDLVNEATLARYLGDVLGDSRQASLLEQLKLNIGKPSAGGAINRLIDYGIDKLNSPEALIGRARSSTVGGSTLPSGASKLPPQSGGTTQTPPIKVKSTYKGSVSQSNDYVKNLKAQNIDDLTNEQFINLKGGWKMPELRKSFDRALGNLKSGAGADVARVKKLLPDVPIAYVKSLSKEISKIIGEDVVKYLKGLKGQGEIPPTNLMNQATKYKSAEEFVKATRDKLQKTLGQDAGEVVNLTNFEFSKVPTPKPHYKLDLNSNTTRNIVDRFKKDIQQGKEIPPIVLDKSGNVIDGAHRLQAYKELGIKEVPVVRPAKNLSQLTDIWNKANKK